MDAHLQTEVQTGSARTLDHDAIIVGAGMSGLYQLYRLRELGMRVKVLEAGTGVGGTWYRHRYPGARFGSESYSYSYSFSKELLEEWNWSEHFAGQPETLRYLNHIADKFNLRRDIQLRSRVTAAHATGFDAITGSFDRIDIRGADRQKLKDTWTPGPRTYLGVQVEGFPNMMMLTEPHTALGNIPRSIEYNVDWVTRLIAYMRAHDLTRAEATPEGVASWTDHVKALGVGLLSNEVNSWMTGINSSVEGKQTRIIARYSGSTPLTARAAMRSRRMDIGNSRWPRWRHAVGYVRNANREWRAIDVGDGGWLSDPAGERCRCSIRYIPPSIPYQDRVPAVSERTQEMCMNPSKSALKDNSPMIDVRSRSSSDVAASFWAP